MYSAWRMGREVERSLLLILHHSNTHEPPTQQTTRTSGAETPFPSRYEKIYLRILPPSSIPHFSLTHSLLTSSLLKQSKLIKNHVFSFAQLWLRDLLLVLNSKLTNSTQPRPPRCEWWLMVFCWWWKWNLVLYLIFFFFFFFGFNDQWKT